MAIFKKGELSMLFPFYIERLISHIFFFAPAFWVIQLQKSFSLTQIGILFATLAVSSFIFEIPTGAFADIYGRKASSLLGFFLTGLVLICIYFTTNFYLILILALLWGLSSTFISGARESWVVDYIKSRKKPELVKEYYIKEQSLIRLSLFLAGILGTFIVAKMGLDVIWIFAGSSFIISGIMLSFIKEHKVNIKKNHSLKTLFIQARDSIRFSLGHHVLFFIILATFFIMFRDSFSGDLVWQPFLKEVGFPVYAFGLLFSAITLIGTFVPFLANPLLGWFKKEKYYLAFLIFVSMVLNFSVSFINNYILAALVFLLIWTVVDLYTPIGSSYFQKHVPSKMRATVTSFQAMVVSLAYTISSPISGILADSIGPRYTIVIGGFVLVPAIVLYLWIRD